MANNAQAYQKGEHPGYEETAWEGIKQTIEVISTKRIKVIINGGALNPKGLALKVKELVSGYLIIPKKPIQALITHRYGQMALISRSRTFLVTTCIQSLALTCQSRSMNFDTSMEITSP